MTIVTDDFSTDPSTRWVEIVGTNLAWNSGAGTYDSPSLQAVAIYNTSLGSTTHWAKAQFLTANGQGGIVLRSTGTASDKYYYVCRQAADRVDLCIGSTSGWIQDLPTASIANIADNDVIATTITGTGTSTIVRVWKNPTNATPAAVDGWDSASDTADATISLSGWGGSNFADNGTYAGVGFWSAQSYDNFSAGDFAASVAKPKLMNSMLRRRRQG